ncbi:MAG: cbb3-type cytochrome c oxidase subunit 3 [Alphaproteobacteria bacterium]|nr:cbb3-type cytochrome c oxidase subunit 3 [Alphaproteobacteria bacterium]
MIAASLNPVFRAASEAHDLGWLGSVSTLLFVVAFLAWSWVAYNPRNRARWEAAGRLPLEDDSSPGGDA